MIVGNSFYLCGLCGSTYFLTIAQILSNILKRYYTPEKACNFSFSTEKMTFQIRIKKLQVKITSRCKVMPVCFLTVTSSLTNYQNWGKFLV